MANHPPSHYLDIGQIGEDLVTQWLQSRDWVVLHRRFCSRWGEIDIIAEYQAGVQEYKGAEEVLHTQHLTLAFIEVKTRSPGNWDAGGRSAITRQKQAKLWRTAETFLAQYPQKADYYCRFDVAIVGCQQISNLPTQSKLDQEILFSLAVAGYEFHLEEYIPAAFDYLID